MGRLRFSDVADKQDAPPPKRSGASSASPTIRELDRMMGLPIVAFAGP